MEYINNIDTRFQEMFAKFLRDRTNVLTSSETSHLDEDTIAAFVDRGLTLRELDPVIEHLADCGYCRRSTAALLRLEAEFEDVPVELANTAQETNGISEALSSWFAKLFGSSAEGVFAHGEEDDDDAENSKATKEDEPEK